MTISDETSTEDEFADQLLDMLNQGALSSMVSIGHSTGLFDSLAELASPGCEQLDKHAGLDARDVREWLDTMVTGGIVKYLPRMGEYLLPGSHSALLIRSAAPDNIAVFAQNIGIRGQIEDRIVDCFRQGGAGLGTMWGEKLALEMLGKAGVDAVDVHQLEHDFQNNFYVTRKAA